MSSNQRIEFPELVNKILENVIKINQSRYFIAIAGAPASGKSTISEKLKSELISKNHKSSVLQMDGFHLDNNILEKNYNFKKVFRKNIWSLGTLSNMRAEDIIFFKK